MADEADMASEYIDSEVSRALGKLRQKSDAKTNSKMGPKVCKECGEVIPIERRKLGFQRCIICAEENERRKSLFADY